MANLLLPVAAAAVLLSLVAGGTALPRLAPAPKPCTQTTCVAKPFAASPCIRDTPARVFPAINTTDSSLTHSECQVFCYAWAGGKGPVYAGMEFGHECYCSLTAPPPSSYAPASDCNVPCGGNKSETCGAAYRISVDEVASCTTTKLDYPFCDESLSVPERVASLVGLMTSDEKVACMADNKCTLPRLGLTFGNIWAESLHGLRRNCAVIQGSGDLACPTSFPHAQLLAASFNRTLWATVGTGIANEAAAFYNIFQAGISPSALHSVSFFAPDLNLCRDPRWGRCVEVPSEDPLVTSEYGMQYIRSMQEQDASGIYKSLVNVKHFQSYGVEHGTTNQGTGEAYDRGGFNANISALDLAETHLVMFQSVTKGANMSGTMCSYNAVNGVPSCANEYMNVKVLREMFNWTGMIVSDCGAVNGIEVRHHYANGTGPTCAAALKGTVDLNCGSYYDQHLADALKTGDVTIEQIDTSVARVLTQLVQVGLLNSERFPEFGLDVIDSPAMRDLAKDAARQGFVLLRNEGDLLPIRAKTPGTKLKVAVLGPNMNASISLLGNYYGQNVLVESQTPLLGLQRRPEIEVIGAAQGCDLASNDTSGIAGAAALAAKADVAVVFLGLTSGQGQQVNNTAAMEREGFDRTFLTLPGVQLEFVKAIVASGTPVVTVLINSGPLAAEWVYDNVPAVLEAFYPGEMGGDAVASVLLGDVSPSGRMPNTIYAANFTALRNITDYTMRTHTAPDGVSTVPGLTYRFVPQSEVLFPFGFGLSYTPLSYALTHGSTATIELTTAQLLGAWDEYYKPARTCPLPSLNVTVSNAGGMDTDVVTMAFTTKLDSSTQLFDFDRSHVPEEGRRRRRPLLVAPGLYRRRRHRGGAHRERDIRHASGWHPAGLCFLHPQGHRAPARRLRPPRAVSLG